MKRVAAGPVGSDLVNAEYTAVQALLKSLSYDPKEVIRPLTDPNKLADEAAAMAGSLKLFIPEAWQLCEPATFIPNWHIDAIAEHLEAITAGDIKDLLVTMPPRHSKSLIVSVLWPAWEWVNIPSYRWVFASYAFSLSVRDSIKRRKIIRSQWYKDRFADRFVILEEQNTKIRYENDKGGFQLASSVGGSNTGEGGERIVADDPHNVKKSESEDVRHDTVDWWNIVMSTRRNDINKSARVVVQQRTHEGDVAGDIIEKGGYVHLNLPTEFGFAGGQRCRTGWTRAATGESISWEDPRQVEGELLNPQRFDQRANEAAKIDLGDYQYACTPAGTPITMADWTSKPIEKIVPGDVVLGFDPRGAAAGKGEAQKQRLFPSMVVHTFAYSGEVFNLHMSSGRTVRCTADHKWWTRRQPTKAESNRKQYAPARVGNPLWWLASESDRVVSISNPVTEPVYALETETGNYIAWGYASSNSQHGQNPAPPKGSIIQAQWLRYYGGPCPIPIPDWSRATNAFTPLLSLDCAFKEHRDTDFVAGLGWVQIGADLYLMPICIHKRMNFPDTIDAVAEFVGGTSLDQQTTYPGIYPFIKIKLVEDKANGSAVIDTLRHRIPGMLPYEPGNASKTSRLQSASWRFRAGNVYLPHESIAPWIKEYVYELCAFPKAKKDDYVDATSQALLFIGGGGTFEGEPTVMSQGDSRWFSFDVSDVSGGTSIWGPAQGSGGSISRWKIR